MSAATTRRNGAAPAAPTIDLDALSAPVLGLPEAPVSLSLRTPYRGREVQVTIRGTEDAVAFQRLDAVLAWLDAMGETPTAVSATEASVRTSATVTDGQAVPVCPNHNKPMRQGKYGWFCPTKIADDDGTGKAVWCKHKVAAS